MVRKTYNLLVVGYYYKKNYGDDLLLEVAQKLLISKYHNNEISIKTKFFSTEDIKPIPQLCSELVAWSDKVILFGGEVLNSYFLDRLIYLKNYAVYELKKNITFYAIGVSINENLENIQSKLDLFETVIFRNTNDYNQLLPRLTETYSKSLPDPVFLLKPCKSKGNFFPRGKTKDFQYNVGYFLSQTAHPTEEYIQSIVATIRHWFIHKARVFLFTMCNNSSPKECDTIINGLIFNEFNYFEKENVVFLDKPHVILDYIGEIDFAICWRFHAHIFCIQNKIPFLSISETPKVLNLLRDNKLEEYHYISRPIINGIDMLVERRAEIKKSLELVYHENYKRVQDYKSWQTYLFRERSLPRFYIDIQNPIIIQNLEKNFIELNPISPEDKASVILYYITGKIKTEYHWGMAEKFRMGATFQMLIKDYQWLISEEIKKGEPSFYYRMAELLKIHYIIFPNITDRFLNIHYTDQNDMRGFHRAGWQYVIDNIEHQLSSNHHSAVLCDLYVDRTFHWNLEINRKLGIVPYKKHWIGFIHHTCNTNYSNYNTVELFNKREFIDSLPYCRGIIVLSTYLRKMVAIILKRLGYNIPIFSLFHPTEFVDDKQLFNFNDFINSNEKKVVQVGAWYRDIDAIYRLTLGQNPLKINRYALKGPNMDSYYSNKLAAEQISRDQQVRGLVSRAKTMAYALERPVQIINCLNADGYDNLFKTSIIFIRLLDASAVNTIIEAIVRNSPILVNPLDAVIEYLGKDYPFYYNTMEEATKKICDASLIRKAYFYLKKMDKTNLKIETFLCGMKKLKIRQIV